MKISSERFEKLANKFDSRNILEFENSDVRAVTKITTPNGKFDVCYETSNPKPEYWLIDKSNCNIIVDNKTVTNLVKSLEKI